MYNVKSPILFLIFNRPKETNIVFNSIKIAKPKKLYIAADGPRNNGKDEILCVETKRILNQIDWECEVKTLFRDENLGCGLAVSSAISWFFKNEEEGIILEDDCNPNNDFFRFCDEMLDLYRNETKIGHICGCNFQDNIIRDDGDYYFSRLTHVWGWASWKRVWKEYNYDMNQLDNQIELDFLNPLTKNKHFKNFLYYILKQTQLGKINTWDYQYFFTNRIKNFLSIIPNYNLISNIGFNELGTHTSDPNSLQANIPHSELPVKMNHPTKTSQNYLADDYTLKKEIPSRLIFYKMILKLKLKSILTK